MCGIFGIEGHADAANFTYLGLYALQHRGQESSGIVSMDGQTLRVERGMGEIADVFDEETLARLPGRRALGHTRYSTSGSSERFEVLTDDPVQHSVAGRPLLIARRR
jgi:amidophosphoribosyltransferase